MARTFGTSDYIDIAANSALGDSVFTVAIWIKSTSAAQWEVLGRHNAAFSREGWGLEAQPGSPYRISLYTKDSSPSSWGLGDTTANIIDGNWHAVLCRISRANGGALEMMVDGVSNTPAANGAAWDYNAGTPPPLRIGRSTDSFWAGYAGDLANFALWNGRLSEDEAVAYCKGMSPGQIRPSALRAWLPLRT